MHRKLHQTLQFALMGVGAVALLGLAVAPASAANPTLFDSVARMHFSEFSGGVYYYDYQLTSSSLPYHEIYLVLDPEKVTPVEDGAAVGADARFTSAEITKVNGAVPGDPVDLYFSDDMRSFANIDNPRFLNFNEMDTYDPDLTDPLPLDTYSLQLRFGLNRTLTDYEMGQVGYWAGDLRGMIDPSEVFTESDGRPVPEPATALLALVGAAGLAARRRFRK